MYMFKRNLILVSVILAIVLVGCGQEDSVDKTMEIKERGYLIMGLDDTFAPMGFRDEKGELVGFDIDLANELSKKIDLDIKFQPIDWSMKETELKSGKIDLIWNGYSITDARKKEVNFSDVYLSNRQIIITLKDSDIKSKEDLAGRKLAVQNASSSLEAISKDMDLIESLDQGEPILFDTNHEAFLDLEAGRSEVLVSDEVLAKYYMAEKGQDIYNILNDDFGREDYAIGMRKSDTELVKIINDGLTEMKEDGSYDELYNKWFN